VACHPEHLPADQVGHADRGHTAEEGIVLEVDHTLGDHHRRPTESAEEAGSVAADQAVLVEDTGGRDGVGSLGEDTLAAEDFLAEDSLVLVLVEFVGVDLAAGQEALVDREGLVVLAEAGILEAARDRDIHAEAAGNLAEVHFQVVLGGLVVMADLTENRTSLAYRRYHLLQTRPR